MAQPVDAAALSGALSGEAAIYAPPAIRDQVDRPTNSRSSREEKRQTISIVVIDKSPLFRAGITHLLTGSRFHVKVSCSCFQELPARAFSAQASVFLVSLGPDWRAQLPNIASLVTQGIRILLIGEEFRPDEMIAGIQAGIGGYLSKDQINADLLLKSLELVHLGGAAVMGPFEVRLPIDGMPAAWGPCDDDVQGNGKALIPLHTPTPTEQHPSFSDREYQVLKFLKNGASNKQIARELCIAEPTVKVHVKNLFRKIGAKNRTQAAMWPMHG